MIDDKRVVVMRAADKKAGTLKVDYGVFLVDAEKTIKDTLGLIDGIVGDGTLKNEAYTVMRDIGSMFLGFNIAGMLVVIVDLEALITAMKTDGDLPQRALTVITDLEKLKVDMGI